MGQNYFQPPQTSMTPLSGNDAFMTMLTQMLAQKKAAEQQQGGGMWGTLLGPAGDLFGQTIDGEDGIDIGQTGRVFGNNVKTAAKFAPMML